MTEEQIRYVKDGLSIQKLYIALGCIEELEKENEQLQKNNKHIQDLIEAERQRQEECNNVHLRDIEELEKENEKLRQQIEKMKNCVNCKYFVDVDNVCNQGLYLPNRDFTECYNWELAE